MHFGDSCPCPENAQFLASRVKSENAVAPSHADLDTDEEFARRLQAELNGDIEHTPPTAPPPNPGLLHYAENKRII
jgi:hypothetical protein